MPENQIPETPAECKRCNNSGLSSSRFYTSGRICTSCDWYAWGTDGRQEAYSQAVAEAQKAARLARRAARAAAKAGA